MENTLFMARGSGSNYMMRSQKRTGSGSYGMPPRRRKHSRHILYKVITLLMLVVCFPVGLILLWRRKIRWSGSSKLLLSIASLIVFFISMSVLLLYPFENPRVTKVQQAMLHVLDETREGLGRFGEWTKQGAQQAGENFRALTGHAPQVVAAAGNEAVRQIRELVASPSPEPTATPEPTSTPVPTPAPRQRYVSPAEGYDRSVMLYAVDMLLTGKSDHLTEEPAETEEPEETPVPMQAPSPDVAATEGLVASQEPSVTVSAPTDSPEPEDTEEPVTPEPTPDPALTRIVVVPADQATVYYTTTGVNYHSGPVCGPMTDARPHTLAEALQAGKNRCPYCEPVPLTYAEEGAWLAFLDEERSTWHIDPQCQEISMAGVKEMLYSELPTGVAACVACRALEYQLSMNPDSPASSINPDMLTNGETLVYYNEQSGYYHKSAKCEGSAQMSFAAHTLYEATVEGKTPCPVCEPEDPAFD